MLSKKIKGQFMYLYKRINYMRIIILFFLFNLLFSISTFSQNVPSPVPEQSGSSNLYLLNGVQIFNFNQINDSISSGGYPKIKNIQNCYGIGGFGTIGAIILGGEGCTFSNEKQNDTTTTRSEGGQGLFYIGYKFISTRHVDFYPVLGAGLGGVKVTILKPHPDMAFGNFLASPFNAAQLGLGSVLFNISAALNYRLQKKNTLFFGIRVGYNLTGTSEWNIDSSHFVNAPEDKFASFYAHVIGGISIGN